MSDDYHFLTSVHPRKCRCIELNSSPIFSSDLSSSFFSSDGSTVYNLRQPKLSLYKPCGHNSANYRTNYRHGIDLSLRRYIVL